MTDRAVDKVLDKVLAPLVIRGGSAYLGEPVTQLEHALQSAELASSAGASPALVVAALLHDVGWLLGAPIPSAGDVDSPDGDSLRGAGDHGARSAAHLVQWLPPAVIEPVRLHVAAKRWLCTTSPDYRDRLSEESRRTLVLQGGEMDPAELTAFAAHLFVADAVALRRWDDEAKTPGRRVPPLEHWRPLVAEVVARPDI